MKYLITILCIAVMAISVVAQTQQNKPFTKSEELKIREGVSAVMTYIETQQSLDSLALKTGKVEIVDVVDKALDKFGTAVTFVCSNVEKAAPKVWSIMVWQQYAKAISGLLGPLLTLLMIFILYRYVNRHWTPAIDKTWNDNFETSTSAYWWRNVFTKALPLVASFLTCWALFAEAKTSVLLFVNPQYYAIRDLLVMLLGNSHGM